MIERIVRVCVCAHLCVIMRTPVREGGMKMRVCAYREADVSARAREREREHSFESDESAKRVHKKENEREIESKRHIRRTQT